MSIHKQTTALLVELELALRSSRLWSSTLPTPAALSSSAPFACDTMPFESWLQFIFIPKMMTIIETEQVLPRKIALLPMAEQVYAGEQQLAHLFTALKNIDALLCGQPDVQAVD